ncbi:MAG: tetratricopeptide repeat protein [Pseudomonadota bacterium]
MMRGCKFVAAIYCVVLLAACASRPPASATATLAQASTQRGAQSFARGDMEAAQREYLTALRIAESLDDKPGRAAASLSLSRIASQSGRPADALSAVNSVFAEKAFLPPALLVTAHGRAAALYLAEGKPQSLQQSSAQLAEADALCAANCPDAGALLVLHARLALAQQQTAIALKYANDALASAALAATTPPALNPQANAERANALRVRAEAQLAGTQNEAAITSATEALQLDRALGLADRVLLDLRLLSRAHQQAGAEQMARHYETLAARAQSAGQALRGAQAD